MRLRFSLFILPVFFISLFPQQNTINYKFKLNSRTIFNGGYFIDFTTNIDSGSFKEGENYIVPEDSITSFPKLNPAYNAIEGGVFRVEEGAINEDIFLEIILSGLINNTGRYEKTFDEDLFFKLEILVRTEENGTPVVGNYYFNPGKSLTLTIAKGQKFSAFAADSVGLNLDSLGFAYIEELGFNGSGIETIDKGDSISFKAEHMSKFGGGKGTLRTKTIVDVNDNLETPAAGFNLKQNYPNPFNPETVIEYTVPENGYVSLNVYNSLGQKIETLFNGNVNFGAHKATFSSAKFPSGIYFCELKWNNSRQVIKMILIK